MKKYYKVAGLVFCLDIPGEHPFWQHADNYSPFEVEEGGECIFTLSLTGEQPLGEKTPLYTTKRDSLSPLVDLFDYDEGNYLVQFAPIPTAPLTGDLLLAKDFRSGLLFIRAGRLSSQMFAINNSIMLLYTFASAPYGALEMHSSVVMKDGKGYMFLGRSGTGKSTHSRLWLENIEGCELLNDDNPVLRAMPDGGIIVFGTPWSGKTPCYKNKFAPAGAIVRLEQAPFNQIVRYDPINSYGSVMASSSGFRPIRSIADAQHDTINKIAGRVPCFHLKCLPDKDAADTCFAAVYNPA